MTFPTTHPALARALEARDYATPTAVQLAVLEPAAAKRDLLVSAQTGSGKTVAFGLAMAAQLLGDNEQFESAAEPLALIIAPTRELAMQVHRELEWLYGETNARVVACVGGMETRAEARLLKSGAHIIVGTPGRLRDHIERKRLDLSWLRAIVLDEADEMLDLGFREDLEFILDATPPARQTLLFSATMPREIETLARRYQRDALRIQTISRNEQHADIEYQAVRVGPHETENAVVNTLRFHESRATLVFCATREGVKRTHARLVDRGFSAVALSGELSQAERTQALQSLRDGRARVLVATDVAARGLDLPDLALVIHADLPNDGETLLHRSGRTGRAGRKGLCVLIVPHSKRRKAEMLLSAAKLNVTWTKAPAADDIHSRDQERFLADAVFTAAITNEERALAATLQAERTADEIAVALLRMYRARLPVPAVLAEDTGPPRRDDRERPVRDRGAAPSASGGTRQERPDGRDWTWFQLNIGRDRNADPRWLLPLICRAGNITKAEIGLIRIEERETRFQILTGMADQFALAARTNKTKEGHISKVSERGTALDEPLPEPAVEASTPKPSARSSVAQSRPSRDHEPREAAARRDAPNRFAPRDKAFRDKRSRGPWTAPTGTSAPAKPEWRDHAKPKSGVPAARSNTGAGADGRKPAPSPKRGDDRATPKSPSKYAVKKKHRTARSAAT